jgi:hypothetical protein
MEIFSVILEFLHANIQVLKLKLFLYLPWRRFSGEEV